MLLISYRNRRHCVINAPKAGSFYTIQKDTTNRRGLIASHKYGATGWPSDIGDVLGVVFITEDTDCVESFWTTSDKIVGTWISSPY